MTRANIIKTEGRKTAFITPLSRCEDAGNIAMCLYYLSSEAKKKGLKDVGVLIDTAIAGVISKGRDMYADHLFSSLEKNGVVEGEFIDRFCPSADNSVNAQLKELALDRVSGQTSRGE